MNKVLIIDDDFDISKLLGMCLEAHGYTTRQHPTKRGALDVVDQYQPDLIILDVMLGDGLGYEVSRAIRRSPMHYRRAILFESSAGEDREISHAHEQGGDAYLVKPYSEKQLVEKLGYLKKMIEDERARCLITGLPTLALLRREVDHLIFRSEPVSVSYLMPHGIGEYQRKRGIEAVNRVAALIAKIVAKVMVDFGYGESLLAHLGAAHFMVKLRPQDQHGFKKNLRAAFELRQTELAALGLDATIGSLSREEHIPGDFGLLIGSTNSEHHSYPHASALFHHLQQLDKLGRKADERVAKRHRQEEGQAVWID